MPSAAAKLSVKSGSDAIKIISIAALWRFFHRITLGSDVDYRCGVM